MDNDCCSEINLSNIGQAPCCGPFYLLSSQVDLGIVFHVSINVFDAYLVPSFFYTSHSQIILDNSSIRFSYFPK